MDKHNSETSDPKMKKVDKEELNKTPSKNGTKKESHPKEDGKSVNKDSNGKEEKSKHPTEGASKNKESSNKDSKDKKSIPGDSKDKKSSDGDSKDKKSVPGDSKDKKTSDGDSKDKKSVPGDSKDKKSIPGDSKDKKTSDGDSKDKKSVPGDSKDKKSVPGDSKDKKSVPGDSKDKKSVPGDSKDKKSVPGDSKDKKSVTEDSKDKKSVSGDSKDKKTSDGDSKDKKSVPGDSKDKKSSDSDSKDKKSMSGDSKDKKSVSEDSKDKRTSGGDSKDKKSSDGDSKDKKSVPGDSKDKKTSDDSKDKKSVPGDSKDKKSVPGDSKDKKSVTEDSKDKKSVTEDSKDKKTSDRDSKDKKSVSEDSKDKKSVSEDSKDKKSVSEDSKDKKTSDGDSKDKKSVTGDSKNKESPDVDSKNKTPSGDSKKQMSVTEDSKSKKTPDEDSKSKDSSGDKESPDESSKRKKSSDDSEDKECSDKGSKRKKDDDSEDKESSDEDSKKKKSSDGDSKKKDEEGSKEKDPVSVDKITVEDGSEILVTLNPEESSEKKDNQSNKVSSEGGKKDKTVIKLTEDDDVQFLSEENIGGKAVEINLAENSLRDIAKQGSSNDNWNKNGQCHMNNTKQNNSLPNNYDCTNSKTPYSSNTSMSHQNSPNTPYAPVLGSNSMNKSGYASCSSSSPFSPNLNDTDDGRDLAPTSSMQQIESIKRETLLHSMSVKMQRILKERAKAELLKKVDEPLGPLANFLNNLGLDIVKQSVYQEAIHIQSRKQQASKLTDTECSQLDKMRASCKELSLKLNHLKLSYRKCKLCNFVSESVNVHFWHREHPHINKREDLCCSYCAFVTRNNVAFNFHMESEHNIKGRSMDKPSFWQCTLCPFEHNSKTKLTQHKFKCEKIFELKTHLAPSPETDINYSLYGVFYLSEKEEALKAIALHKAKQAQLKAQQAQYKLQQQQVAVNRANYFNANKIGPMQGNMNQRYPMMVQNKMHGSVMQSPNQMGNQSRSNCYQHQSHIRSSMVRPPTQTMNKFTPGRGNMVQNHYRGSSMTNQGINNSSSMHSRLPVKDLINMNQSGKNQAMMSNRSVTNQKYVPNSHANDVSAFETCELCNGYVKDRNALRIHLFYAHKVEMPALMFEKPNPPLFCDVCDRKFWTSQGLQKHRVLLKHYAKGSLSQVCIVCGCQVTHLLNHMTNTHQINLQDFLNQKRCIVCGIVCQSRSGTEIHMASSHGILVKHSGTNSYETTLKKCTTPTYNMANKGGYTPPSQTQTKGHYCMFCKVPFPTSMELNRHRLLAHKSCPRCSMVLPNAQALAHHKCQMRVLTKKVCKVCKQQIPLSNFIRHVQERHLKKYKVSLKRVSSDKIKSGIKDKVIHVDLTDEPSSPLQEDDETTKGRGSVPPNFTLPKQKFDPRRMKRKRPLDPEDYYPTADSDKESSEGGTNSKQSKIDLDSSKDTNNFKKKPAEERSRR